MSSNFSCVLASFFFFSRCLRKPRPSSSMAFRASSRTSSLSATASLASEVNWTLVLARCTRTAAGPFGTPLPPGWSKPYWRQSTDSIALVNMHPPCWYIRGTRLAKRRTSTAESAGMPSPKMRPTSIWKGLPELTAGARVSVVTKRESIVFDSPFLMRSSSMGDKQSMGGLSSFTGSKTMRGSHVLRRCLEMASAVCLFHGPSPCVLWTVLRNSTRLSSQCMSVREVTMSSRSSMVASVSASIRSPCLASAMGALGTPGRRASAT